MQPDLMATFLQEADDLLAEVEETALGMDALPPEPELVHRLFRAFHTIKGSGGMVGLNGVASFTHHVETLLDSVREGEQPVTKELVDIVLAAKDQIAKMLDEARENGDMGVDDAGASLISRIQEFSRGARSAPALPASSPGAEVVVNKPAGEQSAPRTWTIRFKPEPNMLATGCNPLLLFRDLQKLGTCEITGRTDRLPPLDEMEPLTLYLWWTITLRGGVDENAHPRRFPVCGRRQRTRDSGG